MGLYIKIFSETNKQLREKTENHSEDFPNGHLLEMLKQAT